MCNLPSGTTVNPDQIPYLQHMVSAYLLVILHMLPLFGVQTTLNPVGAMTAGMEKVQLLVSFSVVRKDIYIT